MTPHHWLRLALIGVVMSRLMGADQLDTLVHDRVLTLPPDLPRTKAYPDGAVASGDLFKSGKRTAVAVATTQGHSLALACFVHRDGDWREIARQSFGEGDQRPTFEDEIPFTFADLDGDAKPELLLTEHGGGDDRTVRVFRFDGETDTLVAAGGGLRNPTWQDGAVRGQCKLGPTAGDLYAEQYRWVDGRLQLVWRCAQRYPMHEYLIGGGEPAVRVMLDTVDTTGTLTATSAIGNLASYRNRLPAGEQPRALHLLVRETKGRRLVEVTPKADGLRAANRARQWDEIISRAVFADPSAFTNDMTVTLGDAGKVKLAEIATVSIAPTTTSPTYQFLPISDDVRRTFEEPGTIPAMASANLGTTDVTRMEDAALAWATAATAKAPLATGDDVVVFLRLPNITGYPIDQIESGTLVTALTLADKVAQMTVTIDPGQRPSLPTKAVARPLIAVSLGRLIKGAYRVSATITGHSDGPLKVDHAFTVQ
ncbi:MAG TPA: hypothetical protein VHX44_03155 [Planctomycetota bacterium]|nr:hypothetical protein [Planctomycetota bacterium]